MRPRLTADLPACSIQTCLQKENYNETKCASYVDALYRCCAKMYAQGTSHEGKSTACPIQSVVERRMKQRGVS